MMGTRRITPKSLANLRPWKKGKSGNPNGRPPAGIKKLRTLNRQILTKLVTKYARMSYDEIKAVLSNPTEVSAIDLLVARIVEEGIWYGDRTRAEFIIEQMCGKLTQPIELEAGKTMADLIREAEAIDDAQTNGDK